MELESRAGLPRLWPAQEKMERVLALASQAWPRTVQLLAVKRGCVCSSRPQRRCKMPSFVEWPKSYGTCETCSRLENAETGSLNGLRGCHFVAAGVNLWKTQEVS